MTIMKSKFKYMYDADSSVALRAKGSAAITATGNSTELALDAPLGYWNAGSGDLADQTLAVVINVESVDHTSDETYVLDVQVGPVGFASNAVVGKIAAVPTVGQYVVLLDMDTALKVKSGAAAIRIVATLGGTTPSLDYYAWLSGVQK